MATTIGETTQMRTDMQRFLSTMEAISRECRLPDVIAHKASPDVTAVLGALPDADFDLVCDMLEMQLRVLRRVQDSGCPLASDPYIRFHHVNCLIGSFLLHLKEEHAHQPINARTGGCA